MYVPRTGVLVLDEIQDLSDAKGGGASRMLNFFVQMENTLGIPFVFIGTPKVKELFAGEFRQARRISEQGDIVWRPMREIAEKEKDDEPDKADPEWNAFVRAMWKYWYLKKDHPLPGEKLRAQAPGAPSAISLSEDDKEKCLLEDSAVRTLYKESQGITAVVVTIFFLAQRRAITSGREDVTSSVIRHAVRDNQHYIKWMLERLREGRWKPIGRKKISDLDVSVAQPLETVKPDSDKSGEAKKDAKKTDREKSDAKQNGSKPMSGKTGGKRKPSKASETYAPDDLRRLHSEDKNKVTSEVSLSQPDCFASGAGFLD
ncbi:MAG TPA: hypothetical protein VF791_14045 [Pyrinomonadaceae bacterium]